MNVGDFITVNDKGYVSKPYPRPERSDWEEA